MLADLLSGKYASASLGFYREALKPPDDPLKPHDPAKVWNDVGVIFHGNEKIQEAASLYLQAVLVGDPDACNNLASLYEKSLKNNQLASKYYLLGASRGNMGCQIRLATAYRDGDLGLKKNPEKAKEYQRAVSKHKKMKSKSQSASTS
jgi:TPR repeat protein